MSAVPAVTMQDLELEHAELLPARETLCVGHLYPGPVTPARVRSTSIQVPSTTIRVPSAPSEVNDAARCGGTPPLCPPGAGACSLPGP